METSTGLRLDLGCGANKKPGTLGIDIQAQPGVDYVLDLETQPLPFENDSVAYVHSSHFLEHLINPGDIYSEISRVCMDQAHLDLWTPYAWGNSAFVLGHKTFFTEEIYLHICVLYMDFWNKALGKRWILNELQYVVELKTLHYLRAKRIGLDFALRHLQNIATEFCAYITVYNDLTLPSPPLRRTFSVGRFAPRYELKDTSAFADAPGDAERTVRAFAKGAALPPYNL